MSRRLISTIQHVVLYNDKDLEENWIPMRVNNVDSWMMLQASTYGF